MESARNDAEILLSHVMGMPRALVALTARPSPKDAARPGWCPQPEQLAVFQRMVDARATRVPLQHLTGRAGFRYVDLEVGPGVFVPRPETELLAGWAIDAARTASGRTRRRRPLYRVRRDCAVAGRTRFRPPRFTQSSWTKVAHGWALRNLSGTGVDLRLGDAADAFRRSRRHRRRRRREPAVHPAGRVGERRAEARDHDPAPRPVVRR